jgi:hypothetical protein
MGPGSGVLGCDRRDEADAGAALGLGLLRLADLLHLEHPLHDELVLALLVGVALRLTFPGKVVLGDAALVERDEEVRALVAVRQRHTRLRHLCLRRDLRLRGAQLHAGRRRRCLHASLVPLSRRLGRRLSGGWCGFGAPCGRAGGGLGLGSGPPWLILSEASGGVTVSVTLYRASSN